MRVRQPLSFLLSLLLFAGGFPLSSWASFRTITRGPIQVTRTETFTDWVIFIDPDRMTYFARRADYDKAKEALNGGGGEKLPDPRHKDRYTTQLRIPVYHFKAPADPMENAADVPLSIEASRSKTDLSAKDLVVRLIHFHGQAVPPTQVLEVWEKGAEKSLDIPVRPCDPKRDMTCGNLITVSRNGYQRQVRVTFEGKRLYSKDAPAPPETDPSVFPPSLLKALEEKFPHSVEIERLVAAQIVLHEAGNKDPLAAIAALKTEPERKAAFAKLIGNDLHGKAVGMIKKHLSGQGTEPPVKAVLDSGKKDEDFLAGYCPRLYHTLTPAQKKGKPVWEKAQQIFTAGKIAANAPDETAVGAFNQAYSAAQEDNLLQRCEAFLNRKASTVGIAMTEFQQKGPSIGAGTSVPLPAAMDKNAGGKEQGGLKGLLSKPGAKEGLFAGMAGGIGFGLAGFLLGGPIGALVMGGIGAAVLGGITYFSAKKK